MAKSSAVVITQCLVWKRANKIYFWMKPSIQQNVDRSEKNWSEGSPLHFSVQFLCSDGKCPVDRGPLFDVSSSELDIMCQCAMIQIETDKQTIANIKNVHNINRSCPLQIIAKVFLSIFIKLYEKLLKCEQEFLLGFFS